MDSAPEQTSEPEDPIKWVVKIAQAAAEEKDRRRQARQESLVNPHRR